MTYSVDNYYKDVLKPTVQVKEKVVKQPVIKPKAPKLYNIQDHQFFDEKLVTLLEREQLAHKREIKYQYSVDDFGDSDEEFLEQEDEDDLTRDEKRKLAQEKN